MPRSVASIQAEIDTIESHLQGASSVLGSVGSDGTTISNAQRKALEERLDKLYMHKDRANGTAPMFVRSRVKGLNDA